MAAYEAQQLIVLARTVAGETVVGARLVYPPIAERVESGQSEPAFGIVTSDMLASYGTAADLTGPGAVSASPGIAFLLAEPVSVLVDTFDTGLVDDEKISEIVRAQFKLTPRGIIETLDLRRPIYKKTAAFGHFGRNEPEFTWERTDKAKALKSDAGIK